MGNYLPAPNLKKHSVNGSLDEYPFRWTSSEMQGWREHMEDSHLVDFDLPAQSPVHVLGVFDGHGGAHVARYVASNLVSTLVKFPEFMKGDYESALKAAYLRLDEQLWLEKAQSTLLQYITQPQPVINAGSSRTTESLAAQIKYNKNLSNQCNKEDDLNVSTLPIKELENLSQLYMEKTNAVVSDQTFASKDFAENLPNNNIDNLNGSKSTVPAQSTVMIQSSVDVTTIDKTGDILKKDNSDELLSKEAAKHCSNTSLHSQSNLSCLDSTFTHHREYSTPFLSNVKACFAEMMHATKRLFRVGKVSKYASEDGCLAMLSGCTAVTCLITETEYIVANVGDSRCVLCRKDTAIELSKDHKPQLPEELKRIFSAGGYLWMGRINGNLNLSRAIGDLTYKQNSSLPPDKQIVTAYPDVTVTRRTDDDEFLVLGCDGIWELMSSQGVVNFIRERIEHCDKLSVILEELFELTVSPNPEVFECGCDNMTTILVDLKGIERNFLRQ